MSHIQITNLTKSVVACVIGLSMGCLKNGLAQQLTEFMSRPSVSRPEKFKPLQDVLPDYSGVVFTQIPANVDLSGCHGAQLKKRNVDGSIVSLATDFFEACDPNVSFDGKRILFSGRKKSSDIFQIYEMDTDGSNLRQVTKEDSDCRHPIYLSLFYVITSNEPWYQIAFIKNHNGIQNLFSSKMDGTFVRQLTYNAYGVYEPFLMADGRILVAGWQKSRFNQNMPDRLALFAVNSDGTDYALFAGDQGKLFKSMPCNTESGLVVFVEGPTMDSLGALASVNVRRNFHTYESITSELHGEYSYPSFVKNDEIIVSWRGKDKDKKKNGTFGIYRLDPILGKKALLYDDSQFHSIQAKIISSRHEPDGRSSVVNEQYNIGQLYCLTAYTTDQRMKKDAKIHRVRVTTKSTENQMDVLGEAMVEKDGSFNLQVPANVLLRLQTLDTQGEVLRSCDWIWVKNREARGCIGCHEDGERTPENRLAEALRKPSVDLITHIKEKQK